MITQHIDSQACQPHGNFLTVSLLAEITKAIKRKAFVIGKTLNVLIVLTVFHRLMSNQRKLNE